MKRRTLIAHTVMALVVVGLPSCALAGDETPDYRYRLTVEVDTPDGVRTGSSVIEISTEVAGRYSIPSPGAVAHRVRGEAVTVDLGTHGVLFALLRSEDNGDWAKNLMFLLTPDGPKTGDEGFQEQFDAMLANRAEIELPATFPPVGHLPERPAYPMLVTFADLSDPTSVARVDPDDLAASFGQGVTLRRITVQLTDDAVTSGIEERLGWIREMLTHDASRDGPFFASYPADVSYLKRN